MTNNISIEKNNLVIKIPLKTKRYNPYEADTTEEMDNIVATIDKDKHGNEEMGFCNCIDMSYKGKGDQHTDFFYKYWGEKEEFKKLCKELKIDIIEYPICAYCGGSIYSAFTLGEKGNMCYSCELKNEKEKRSIK